MSEDRAGRALGIARGADWRILAAILPRPRDFAPVPARKPAAFDGTMSQRLAVLRSGFELAIVDSGYQRGVA